jgi:hypothetical protein
MISQGLKKVSSILGNKLNAHLDFLRAAFSDNGQPSSSRLLTVLHSFAAMFVLIFIAVKTGKYPGVDEATGLGGFAVVHYGTNRISKMFGKDAGTPPAPPPIDKQ